MKEGFGERDYNETLQVDLNQVANSDCIIVDKVYAHCQQRKCFPQIEVDIDKKTPTDITFKPGFIVPGTLEISEEEIRPNFRRVQFDLRIPYTISVSSGCNIKGFLPDIHKDVVLYMPNARDEFKFKVVVETSSEVLGEPITSNQTYTFAVGVFIIIKVVGKVQLLIPVYDFCPEPPECEEFTPDNICDEFEYLPFPDFFPPQYEDTNS